MITTMSIASNIGLVYSILLIPIYMIIIDFVVHGLKPTHTYTYNMLWGIPKLIIYAIKTTIYRVNFNYQTYGRIL